MPQVIFAPAALQDLQRLREFLRQKNPAAAKRAAGTIVAALKLLASHPQLGRPVEYIEESGADCRELPIDFGANGYVALYRLEGEFIIILAVRHQREAGYTR